MDIIHPEGRSVMNWLITDMDAYFASVEQMLRPELRGRPVGVVPVVSAGTCVIAASYDAKRCGVKTGTGVREARALCPAIVFVPARPARYVDVHHDILASIDKSAPVHTVYSIDEWSIRLCGDDRRPEQARRLALQIKRQLREDFGPWLTCSIGVASSRLLAKIGSDLHKPDGLTLLPLDELPGPLEHLRLKDLCGISRGMLARLQRHGIENVRQLWNVTRREAVRIWGSAAGGDWWAGFHGLDEPEAPTRRRSMTHANVLEPRLRNETGAQRVLVRLVCRLAQRLRQHGYYARRLEISVQDVRGGSFFTKVPLPCAQDTPTLLLQLDAAWRRRTPGGAAPLKVGAVVADLTPAAQVPRSLFEKIEKLRTVSRTADAINRRCGGATAYFAPMHDCRQPMEDKIAFGRIPDGAGKRTSTAAESSLDPTTTQVSPDGD